MNSMGTPAPTRNQKLLAWVDQIAALTQPDAVHWCDGSQADYDRMWEQMLASGTAQKLNEKKRPNSYLVLSDPADVARVEDRTFICSQHQSDAGPTNNWRDPAEMRATLTGLFRGAMQPGLEAFLDLEAHVQNVVLQSADRQEGVAAFLEKRKPRFVGH